MKTLFTALVLGLVLTGCAALTPRIDALTGTDVVQRCVDYRGTLAFEKMRQATAPSETRASAIAYLEALIAVKCVPAETP